METISMENRRKYKFIGELSMAKTSKVAMESPENVKKDMAKRKKINAKKQIADVNDIRYFYPKTWEEMGSKRGFIEYKMPAEMIKDLLTNRNKLEERIDPQRYLCEYVNEQFGLMGYCVRVIAS